MFPCCNTKLGSTFIAVGSITPRGLFGQHIYVQENKIPFYEPKDHCVAQIHCIKAYQLMRAVI